MVAALVGSWFLDRIRHHGSLSCNRLCTMHKEQIGLKTTIKNESNGIYFEILAKFTLRKIKVYNEQFKNDSVFFYKVIKIKIISKYGMKPKKKSKTIFFFI